MIIETMWGIFHCSRPHLVGQDLIVVVVENLETLNNLKFNCSGTRLKVIKKEVHGELGFILPFECLVMYTTFSFQPI